MNQQKQPGEPPDESVESIFVERPGPKPELESDVHPQRHPDDTGCEHRCRVAGGRLLAGQADTGPLRQSQVLAYLIQPLP